MVDGLKKNLGPERDQRVWVGIPLLLLALLGIVGPILFILWPPSNLTRDYLVLEQLIVNMVEYWEFHDMSINTKFVALEGWTRLPLDGHGTPARATVQFTVERARGGAQRLQLPILHLPETGAETIQDLPTAERDIVEQRDDPRGSGA